MKYHINNKGEVKRCLALIRMCKYGDENHFSSLEQGNKVNDLVLTRKAKNYSEAKTLVLKELYQKKSNEAFPKMELIHLALEQFNRLNILMK